MTSADAEWNDADGSRPNPYLCCTGTCTSPKFVGMSTPMTQADAQAACAAIDSSEPGFGLGTWNLASIHSDADQAAARSACQAASAVMDDASCWIGLSDTATEGTWVWSDTSPTDYLNFAVGEPNAWGGSDSCTETATTSVAADAAACAAAAAADGRTSTNCAAVMTAADGAVAACTYSDSVTAGEPLNGAADCRGVDGCTNCPSRCNVVGSNENGVNLWHTAGSSAGNWNDMDPARELPFVCMVGAATAYVPCTTVDTPAGCSVPPCTSDVDTPYTGCDATCTSTDTPFAGCIAAAAAAAGCEDATVAACTDDACGILAAAGEFCATAVAGTSCSLQ